MFLCLAHSLSFHIDIVDKSAMKEGIKKYKKISIMFDENFIGVTVMYNGKWNWILYFFIADSMAGGYNRGGK